MKKIQKNEKMSSYNKGTKYLNLDTGEILDNFRRDYPFGCLSYVDDDNDEIIDDSSIIQEFNIEREKEKKGYEKVNVYFVL